MQISTFFSSFTGLAFPPITSLPSLIGSLRLSCVSPKMPGKPKLSQSVLIKMDGEDKSLGSSGLFFFYEAAVTV